MTGPEENCEFCLPRILEDEVCRKTWVVLMQPTFISFVDPIKTANQSEAVMGNLSIIY